MARTKGSKNKPKTRAKSSTPMPTVDELQELEDSKKKRHLKAENTSNKYGQYVTAGREWLATLKEGQNNWGSNQAEGDACPDSEDFQHAFDTIPNEHSPRAVRLFLTFKIFQQNRGISTAMGIYSAFRGLWKNSAGDTYRGKWEYNRDEKKWMGNPTSAADVQDLIETIKNKCGEQGGERKHSVAMSKDHMEKIFRQSLAEYPEALGAFSDAKKEASHIKHMMFRAFMSLAWTIWTRNFELIKLQRKHLLLDLVDTYGDGYFEVHLVDRKGWQKQQKEDDLRNNHYKIYSQPLTPACDAKHWVLEWLYYLEHHVYYRQLTGDDYIFPAMSSNGSVQVGEHISHDTVQKWITEFTNSAEIVVPPGGNFTTHCFRRGGAQYRFMFAPTGEKWSLKMIRWWGGWAEGEHTNTLIKYLLDELSSYEGDYSDALCPNRKRDVEDSSLIDKQRESQAVTKEQIDTIISTKLDRGFKEIRSLFTNCVPFALISPPTMCPQPRLEIVTTPVTTLPAIPNSTVTALSSASSQGSWASSSPPSSSSPGPSSSSSPEPAPTINGTPAPIIPDIPIRLSDGRMSPRSNSWREVVNHWLYPDPSRGLTKAMKDWPREWLRAKEYRGKVATQYHYRKTIATEFLHQYNSDDAAFLAAYPEAFNGQTALRKAIEKRREERGDLVRRGPRRKD